MTMISSNNSFYSPQFIIDKLDQSIDFVKQNLRCYCNDPLRDFTRSRKWNFETIVKFLIQIENKSMKSEICNFYDKSSSLSTDSALYQQRMKLHPEALERILYIFTHSFNHKNTINGYYLLASDGSDINISYDPNDTSTLIHSNNRKDYNQFHLNALYDCLNHIYWDINIDTATKTRESDALKEMIVSHIYPVKSIITADRGYEGYDLMTCCIRNNQKFVFRVKDKNGSSSILKNLGLPDESFDRDVKRILTRKQTKETKANRAKYTILTNTVKFSYLDITEDYYELDFRVVTFEIKDGKYEYLITNLDRDEFSIDDLKRLYCMRWEIETGFRKLKYTIGLNGFHSKKRNLIKQEIYARLILYNLSNIIVSNIEAKEKREKYRLKSNFTLAVTNIKLFLDRWIDENELIKRIKKYLVPIRPDRNYDRKVKPQSAKSFNNRIA